MQRNRIEGHTRRPEFAKTVPEYGFAKCTFQIGWHLDGREPVVGVCLLADVGTCKEAYIRTCCISRNLFILFAIPTPMPFTCLASTPLARHAESVHTVDDSIAEYMGPSNCSMALIAFENARIL